MRNSFKKFFKIAPAYFLPSIALAQGPENFQGLINIFIDIINRAIPVIIALATLIFFWGIARFILNAGGGKEREDAKNVMFWGIIVIFILFSVWGIVRILQATFIP